MVIILGCWVKFWEICHQNIYSFWKNFSIYIHIRENLDLNGRIFTPGCPYKTSTFNQTKTRWKNVDVLNGWPLTLKFTNSAFRMLNILFKAILSSFLKNDCGWKYNFLILDGKISCASEILDRWIDAIRLVRKSTCKKLCSLIGGQFENGFRENQVLCLYMSEHYLTVIYVKNQHRYIIVFPFSIIRNTRVPVAYFFLP